MFVPVTFNTQDLVELLPGAQNNGEDLIRQRTRYFRDLFKQPTVNGYPRQFWFAGTSNPLVGSATVLGGGGNVGSYLGGWDANAVNNILNKRLPDTLNVWVNDASNGARAINNHLRRDMELENLDYHDKLAKLAPGERGAVKVPFNWLAVPQLVDLEQGWRNIHHIRLAVDSAIDNGINFVHIEDQGYHKRCGHLGDKELAPFDSYCQILRSANLTATLRLGEDQAKGLGVVFVARTDAYSAKRIEFSKHLDDPNHIDHHFVDFARGVTADGKYYHLKQGVNPATGNTYGLDLAITRMAEVVRLGLAEYVWMETPNADLHTAKSFIDGVNNKLASHGRVAKMLYNHSPSFDWDLGFVKGATKLGDGLIKHVKETIAPTLKNVHGPFTNQHYAAAFDSLRGFIKANGDHIQLDGEFTDATLQEVLLNSLDLAGADTASNAKLAQELAKVFPGAQVQAAIKALQAPINTIESQNNVYRALADARLGLFGKASGLVGVELPLTTLPDFHYEAFNAHRLAMGLVENSMQAYVHQVQRPERKHFEAQKGTAQPYPFYKHQESTGTGVDARFGKMLGSSDTKALEESTEADDLRDRAALEAELLKKKV